MAQDLNYFTCTLGQAAQYKETVPEDERSFDNVLELVDKQAEVYGDRPALGFADFTQEKTTPLSFRELRDLSVQATEVLQESLKPRDQASNSETVGLICSSGLDFVCTWLGLMRLGYTVFLLAPQLNHKGLNHLCETTNASVIFIDDNHYNTFRDVQDDTLSLLKVPSFSRKAKPISTSSAAHPKLTDTAYLRHTSGTSSGLPKPIIQSQLGAVGVLARLPATEHSIATFSTTPLYHGGLADCFRSWSCAAPIWFFPESKAPITCANILKAIQVARGSSSTSARDNIRYFSSVPYVLQMLSEEPDGVDMLKTMDLVGVGGAALPVMVGDRLVENGVRLVSRMGSAECGFLMSSDRDYDKDTEWQYLRCAVDDPNMLAFEPQDGSDLCELVAKPKWPLRNKTNRKDGSFATSDLFERHKSIPNAWKYHSRSDAQITLANGKKFDPAPLEDAIRASLGKVLQDVLVFGAGREYPGAILFGKPTGDSESSIMEKSWPVIEELNKNSSSQARISRAAILCCAPREKPLEKSSKGTLLRKQAEERYSQLIESVYSFSKSSSSRRDDVSDEELPNALLVEFEKILGRPVDAKEDLFQQGVDSIACIQLRRMISSNFLSENQILPLNIIYDCGTVEALAAHIANLRKGQHGNMSSDDDKSSTMDLMKELVQKYSRAESHLENGEPQAQNDHAGKENSSTLHTIILTGATGLLGVHILDALAEMSLVSKVYCLVRGQDKQAAKERVRKALAFRNLDSWEEHADKIVCLPANLTKADLGLDEEDYSTIKTQATVVIHAAWTVNFSLRLKSFDNQIAGTRNLLDLASSGSARFYFISSTAAVGASKGSAPIQERLSSQPSDASSIGYAQSKWVAEQVCAKSAGETSSSPRTTVIRIGQLCGNSDTGVWNSSEAYPLMLSTAGITGALPRLPGQGLNWLPVDQAAAAVVEIIASAVKTQAQRDFESKSSEISVYHVLQPNMLPSWDEMLKWLSESETGPKFETVPPHEWLSKLQNALDTTSHGSLESDKQTHKHPSASLLSFWQDRYGSTSSSADRDSVKKVSTDETSAGQFLHEDAEKKQHARKSSHNDALQELPEKSRFEVQITQRVSKIMADVKPLKQEQVLQMWLWICENVAKTE